MRHWLQYGLVLVCGLSCGLGLYLADVYNDASFGGRGGAIGVAISFIFLFTSSVGTYRSLEKFDEAAEEMGDIISSSTTLEDKVQDNRYRFDSLKDDIEQDAKRQRTTNRCLAIAAALSTVFWGFGDLVAETYLDESVCSCIEPE